MKKLIDFLLKIFGGIKKGMILLMELLWDIK